MIEIYAKFNDNMNRLSVQISGRGVRHIILEHSLAATAYKFV